MRDLHACGRMEGWKDGLPTILLIHTTRDRNPRTHLCAIMIKHALLFVAALFLASFDQASSLSAPSTKAEIESQLLLEHVDPPKRLLKDTADDDEKKMRPEADKKMRADDDDKVKSDDLNELLEDDDDDDDDDDEDDEKDEDAMEELSHFGIGRRRARRRIRRFVRRNRRHPLIRRRRFNHGIGSFGYGYYGGSIYG